MSATNDSLHSRQFDHLDAKLADLVQRLKDCRDPKERKRLLLEMRLYLDEAARPPEGTPSSATGSQNSATAIQSSGPDAD